MARWGENPRDISGVTPRPTGHSDSARRAAARCCARVRLMAVPVAVMPQANARPPAYGYDIASTHGATVAHTPGDPISDPRTPSQWL